MIIVTDYKTTNNINNEILIEYSKIPQCPICQEEVKYRDNRIRYLKFPGGERQAYRISRYKCSRCKILHNCLPDVVVPRKHYASEIICSVIDGTATADDLETEDYPTENTMYLWMEWYRQNLQYIEEYLRSLITRISGKSVNKSAVSILKEQHTNWLAEIIVMVYNSGGVLTPIGS